jgi:hypothetical protein
MMEKVKCTPYNRKQDDEPIPSLFCIITVGVIEAKCLQKDDRGIESVHKKLLSEG